MKTILYLVSTLKRSGPTNQLSYIIKYLDKSKYTPIVLTLSPEPVDSLKPFFIDQLGVEVFTLGLSRIKGLLFAESTIREFIQKNNIDFIHSQGIRADGLARCFSISRVSTIRNYPFYDYPMKFGKLKGSLMARKHCSFICKEPSSFIACSKTISSEFIKHKCKLHHIQNGVDTQKFVSVPDKTKLELKRLLNVDLQKTIFITVGSLISRKDNETLIKGFLSYNKGDSLLLIAGEGPEKQSLQYLADDTVIFLGDIPNVVEYLQLSDCFISSSLAEGLPNTVLEAMACGLPVLLSNIPSHLELFEGKGEFFFATKNHIELASKLKSLDFEEGCKRSTEMINQKFNAELMSRNYQEIYMEKIGE